MAGSRTPDGVAPATRTPVRRLVARSYQRLTPAEQQVADTVLQRPRSVVDLSIDELARTVDVAPAVITRFSRAIGLSGFRALRLNLAEDLGAAAAEDSAGTPLPPASHGPLWEAARQSILGDLAALQEQGEALEPAALIAAATLLAGAPRVLAVGNDSSGMVARRMVSMLARRGWRARVELSPSDSTWAADVDRGDIVVVISHRGQLLGPGGALLAALPTVRQRGARILALTNVPDSPVGRAADLVLATCLPGNTSDEAYVFDPVLPVQLVTARALVTAAVAARQEAAVEGGSA